MNINRLKTASFISLSAMLLLSCVTTRTQLPQQLTCIPTQLFRCEPGEKRCMTIPIIKDFGTVEIVVNFAQRKVRSYSGNKILSDAGIDSVQQKNGLIYLGGKGYGYDKTYRTWTAIIDQENGSLYSTSITTGAGHVIYGKCNVKSE